MTNMKKNILILYTNYGTGHYMAAKALEEHINERYPNYNVETLDALSYSRPIINKLFAKTGNIVARKFRKFRGNLYNKKMYKNYLKNSIFFKFCIKLFWTKKLQNKLKDFNPDIIISTQVGPTGLIAGNKSFTNAKLISVFTDYGIHRMYIAPHEFVDLFCVPTEEIKNKMIELGINKNKIVVTGIPVRKQFINCSHNELSIKKKYNLPTNLPVITFICGGGLGIENGFTYFQILLESNYNFSYIFIAGKNSKLYNKALQLSKKYNKAGHIIGYIDNISEVMSISSLIIGKPGGIITSETLNLEIPLCAIEPIPGQETNNSLFIKNNNYGFYIKNTKDLSHLLENLNNKKINLNKYKKNINKNFKKFSFIDLNNI